MSDDLRYPIGKFHPKERLTDEDRRDLIEVIAVQPRALREAVRGLSDAQLDRPYRPEGWTVRQVIHHVADSHVNSYVRFKWTLTETNPTIKVYDEKAWAELPEAKSLPVDISLRALEALHERWTETMRRITREEWSRALIHPVHGRIDLMYLLQLYDWHGRHHLHHILRLRERMGW